MKLLTQLQTYIKSKFKDNAEESQNKAIRRYMSYFFEYEANIYILNFGITKVESKELKNEIVVTVTLERPGVFIGKGGSVIDKLSAGLSEELGKKVRIDLEESQLWKKLY